MLTPNIKTWLNAHRAEPIDDLYAKLATDKRVTPKVARKEVRAYVRECRTLAARQPADPAVGGVLEAPAPPALHLKPLPFTPPAQGTPTPRSVQSWVVVPDLHVPYHDPRALAIVHTVISLLDPHGILQIGDLLDAYALSRFPKDPRLAGKLQDEIDKARAILAGWRLLAPNARIVALEGNHEDRLRRALWESPPTAQALLTLSAIERRLTWPKLLGLEELRIEYVPYGELFHLPKMVVKHGEKVCSQAAYTAAAEHRKEGISGISGHTHRIGLYSVSDHNGAQTWLEAGHLCDPAKMDYVRRPNWQQGFAVVSIDPETGANAIEIIRTTNGRAVFRDHIIDCTAIPA